MLLAAVLTCQFGSQKLVGQEFPWLNSAFYFGYLIATYPVSVLFVKLPIAKVLAASM
jgi:MFS transporter, ACS family, allantoate permease